MFLFFEEVKVTRKTKIRERDERRRANLRGHDGLGWSLRLPSCMGKRDANTHDIYTWVVNGQMREGPRVV